MQAINKALGRVARGIPVTVDGLTVTPLLDSGAGEVRYLTLEEAVERGGVTVTEVSDGGHVPELLVSNTESRPVFIVDGEQLLGAKQNRIVNLSIMVPPESETVIPVTCVERRRWARQSDEFHPSPHVMYSSARASKMSQVSASLARFDSPATDQGAVWRDIEDTAERHHVRSRTDAMEAIFTGRRDGIDRFVKRLAPVPHQVGAVVALHGRVCGVEFFDAPSTWAKLMPRLVRSWAIDALDEQRQDVPRATDQVDLWKQLDAGSWTVSPSVGLGSDARLTGQNVTAGGLVVDGQVVHLAAFRTR